MTLVAVFVLLTPLFQDAQDTERPLFDLDVSGTFVEGIRKLEKATKCRVRGVETVENKEIKVSVKQAGFHQALDAICRAHGSVRYFLPERMPVTDEVTIGAGDWVDYPASYHGHFKVVIFRFTRTRLDTNEGSGAWVNVGIALLAPPWIRATYGAGARANWNLEQVRDSMGRDLILKKGDENVLPAELYNLMGDHPQHGNVTDSRFILKDFDIAGKLDSVTGRVELRSRGAKVVRVDLEIGSKIETPVGMMTVDSLTELGPHGRGKQWRVGLTFETKEGQDVSALEDEARFQGDSDWVPTFSKWNGTSVELDSFGLPGKPAWMNLRFRTCEQKSQVPFDFKGVTFRKDF